MGSVKSFCPLKLLAESDFGATHGHNVPFKLADMQSKVAQVKRENETRFVPKQMKGQLSNRLQEREVVKEALLTKRKKLKMKIVSTKFALASAQNKRKPSLRAQNSVIGRIAAALRETNRTMEKADEMSEEKSEQPQPDKKEKKTLLH